MSEREGLRLETVGLEVGAAAVTLWLNRPQVENAINVKLVADLKAAVGYLDDHAEALPGVVVIRGAGGNLSRGIDLADFPRDKAPDIHGFNRWERVVVALERLPLATVAVLEGACLGGGLQLALACDLRVAAHDARAGLPEVGQGFVPGMATWRLARLIGLARARSLALSGRSLGADELKALGLAEAVAEPGGVDAAVAALVDAISPVRQPAWSLTRRLLSESFEVSYEDAIGHFLAAQHRAITSEAFLGLLAEQAR